jgi:hypothetical protein
MESHIPVSRLSLVKGKSQRKNRTFWLGWTCPNGAFMALHDLLYYKEPQARSFGSSGLFVLNPVKFPKDLCILLFGYSNSPVLHF